MSSEYVSIEDQDKLNQWLISELGPICEADPAQLSKYVFALIKKPDKTKAQLKEFCNSQLDAFLSTHTRAFVDKLFEVLTDNSYVRPVKPKKEAVVKPAEEPKEKLKRGKENEKKDEEEPPEKRKTASPKRDVSPRRERTLRGQNSAAIISPPETQSSSSEKTSPTNGEVSQRAAPTQRTLRKRISPPPPEDRELRRRRSRSPPRSAQRGRKRSTERVVRRRSRSRSGERKKKQRCRDFDERGFCMRGDACQFDHGPDPVVVDEGGFQKISSKGMLPKPNVMSAAPPNFALPPPGYNPISSTQPPPPGIVTDAGYNPEAPAMSTAPDFSVPPPPLMVAQGWRPTIGSFGVPILPLSGDQGMIPERGMMGRGRRGWGMGGRGGRGGNRMPRGRNDVGKSLEVRNIPPELNSIAKLNEHFSQFGAIVNLQVHFQGEPGAALVTYSSRGEATNAYKSTDPILNNRFIKVFWHNPPEANGDAATPASGANPPVVGPNGEAIEQSPSQQQAALQKPASPKKPVEVVTRAQAVFRNEKFQEEMKKKVADREARKKEKAQLTNLMQVQKKKTELVQKLLAQQKAAFELTKKATDEEQKKKGLKIVAKLKKQIDALRLEQKDNAAKIEELKEKHEQEEEAAKLAAELTKDVAAIETEQSKSLQSKSNSIENDPISQSIDDKTDKVVVIRGFDSNDDITNLRLTLDINGVDPVNFEVIQLGKDATALATYESIEKARQAVSNKTTTHEGRKIRFGWPTENELNQKPLPTHEDILATISAESDSEQEEANV